MYGSFELCILVHAYNLIMNFFNRTSFTETFVIACIIILGVLIVHFAMFWKHSILVCFFGVQSGGETSLMRFSDRREGALFRMLDP